MKSVVFCPISPVLCQTRYLMPKPEDGWSSGSSWTRTDHAVWLRFHTFIIFFSGSLYSIQERGYGPISPPFIANPKAPSFPAAELPGQTVLLNYCIFFGRVPDLSWHGLRIERGSCCKQRKLSDIHPSHTPFLCSLHH